MSAFANFLATRLEVDGFSTEDVLASFLPLAREVLQTHEAGFVAPLLGIQDLQVEGVKVWFEQSKRQPPRHQERALKNVESRGQGAVEVVSESRRVTDVGEASTSTINLSIGQADQLVTHPVYLPGYQAWEHRLDHQDSITDVFSLGMILASLACALDFSVDEDLERFVANRTNLFAIAPGLHPVLAQAIVRMTQLDRHNRATDLAGLINALENYRDQRVDLDLELANTPEYATKDSRSKQRVVLRKLRERLFDISRRNRLLHFQSNAQSVNLTQSSVPLSFDIKNIRPDQLFVWNAERQSEFAAGKAVSLNRFLNFNEALYLPSSLDRILAEARRDRAEYGFAQLRLVACFLRWTNVKEKVADRYDSPLVLLPVELRKQKGIRDTYYLEPQSAEAEINPVVRFEFKRLYNIELPASIDLAKTSMDELFEVIRAKIVASESAIVLEKVDRPRIALIHDKARRKLDQFRRRARLAGRGAHRFLDLDYSYDPANYHPLGIKLFENKIRAPDSRLRSIIEDTPRPRTFFVSPVETPVAEKERTFFSLEEGTSNPYTWQFDLCNATLANFRYRRMSLVRDYDALIEREATNPAFEATFSLAPRPTTLDVCDAPPLADRFDVVSCDPTQATAIGQARAGESYIIQGPPGTGKSQTITNLIADYVARGKRVLFVCEKRAAIDVVYARLRQRGLADLCCLIHDSQTDKKEFVTGLKQTYEAFLNDNVQLASRPPARPDILRQHANELRPLEHIDVAMQSPSETGGLRLRDLFERAVTLHDQRPSLTPLQVERLPAHAMWNANREKIQQFVDALQEVQEDGVLARHPLRLLSPRVASVDRPLESISQSLDVSLQFSQALLSSLGKCGVPNNYWANLGQLRELTDRLRDLLPLAGANQLMLLEQQDEHAKQFVVDVATHRALNATLSEAQERAKGWRQRLAEDECQRALELALRFERTRCAWLRPAWWRLRGIINQAYDFRSHLVPPSWSQSLESLRSLCECENDVRRCEKSIKEKYSVSGDVGSFVTAVSKLQERLPQLSSNLQRLLTGLIKSPHAAQIIKRVLDTEPTASALEQQLAIITDDYAGRALTDLEKELERAQECIEELPDFFHCLTLLGKLPAELSGVFAQFSLNATQLEAAIADKSIQSTLRTDRILNHFSGSDYRPRVGRITGLYDELLDSNAEEIRDRVRAGLQHHVRIAALPAAQLDAEQKEFKKSYNRGRRELEHEFGKSMRFKAIRDLASGDCGNVVKDLKPVWLMSPLSVSDTLPLDTTSFDVVIFDEASQITLEEAVPSLFRAQQAIVVGDEMQLPPTSFFASKQGDDDEELLIEEDGETYNYELESNSFLNHAARNLPATMLGWHYRSRSESLISFSNWAFYEGRLLTVPEEQLSSPERDSLVAATADDAERGADELLKRAISFHFMAHGIYEQRRNSAEAEYIAQLVRRLLSTHPGRSIGIIAFSEAQQSEIEGALARLAQNDEDFRNRYEAELEREDDGQFVGLLVKNLENIQGDERDIIILSVCYGHDSARKMRMNFGPINVSGGEKRLNVAFSRAKHHMAVVSSIHSTDITNEFNEGANCFKNYLRYAEAVSEGQAEAASRVLHGISRSHGTDGTPARAAYDSVSDQLSIALSREGYLVDRAVGQSHFRCDLAIRRPGDASYRLGVLVDTAAYYEQSDILERDVMRPRLLRNFGWKITQVFAKDWYLERDRVLERLLRLLTGEDESGLDSDKELLDGTSSFTSMQNDDGAFSELEHLNLLSTESSSSSSSHTDMAARKLVDLGTDVRRKYLEFTDGKSNKFWEITLSGAAHSVRFGRLGTEGQEMSKSFATPQQAKADFERLVRQKLAKGYVEENSD